MSVAEVLSDSVAEAPRQVRPARVCFMIDRLDQAGTESQLVALIRHLDRTRVEPYLCLLDGEDELSRSLEPENCPVLRLGIRSFWRASTFRRAGWLAALLRRERIDVLQVYFLDSTYLGVAVGRLAGVPAIVRTRNFLANGMSTTHYRLGRFANRFVTATIANSEACRKCFIAHERPSPGSVVVMENGVDLERFPEASAIVPPCSLEGPRRIGAVANLRWVKGIDILVRAAEQISRSNPAVLFRVAGEGPFRSDLELQVAQAGLIERFSLPGRVWDVPAFFAATDVAVVCSREEGMCNALLEAMAAGRAIVATAVGGNVELIEDGVNGLLVPPDDHHRLAQAIEGLLRDPSRAARLGAAARRRVEERHSRQVMVRRFESFYRQLTGLGATPG
jgi:L-malate glycosyltransferase